jgi:hypothetical protein
MWPTLYRVVQPVLNLTSLVNSELTAHDPKSSLRTAVMRQDKHEDLEADLMDTSGHLYDEEG